MKIALLVLVVLFSITMLLPLIRHDYWVFRVFEFPRFQKWCLNLLLLLWTAMHHLAEPDPLLPWIGFWLMFTMAYLSYQIFPFIPLAPRMIRSNRDPNAPNFRVVVSNVYQYNRKSKRLIRECGRFEVDVLVFVETDQWWCDELKAAFDEQYPHQILHPLENTYGMLMFSRWPLADGEVRFLVKEEIPSIRVTVEHEVHPVRFFAIHPEPPVPSENPKSTARDQEIMKVAEEASREEMPTVVAGDLNDVAWSYTTQEFLETSGLKDPRRGRGMYSTFHAKYPLVARWPLDHLFCSEHFSLNRIRCLRRVGSDHLPIYVDLAMKN
ncbi:endonuclease/exonuclease/phosphatase family protein [Marinoscillum furvescens]|uniref:Endonuclease/exonuclease/phosphatase (EEP) superfamily protein YafD n=1 Tax=Marinoscillum furvescens DSM 4134 TaxID=1122208 RepID=A0A3D9L3M6_MARFU|nr:endonuclease/exonuclease/phosphatase family protein [Marinoscillum furvescens]RED98880.1 endonuclease/exonuclease/phosphatase (EEP) superfamily protein YafD [Marinoscillum furvescens DSM 4134]